MNCVKRQRYHSHKVLAIIRKYLGTLHGQTKNRIFSEPIQAAYKAIEEVCELFCNYPLNALAKELENGSSPIKISHANLVNILFSGASSFSLVNLRKRKSDMLLEGRRKLSVSI
jgi:hypothetical protein